VQIIGAPPGRRSIALLATYVFDAPTRAIATMGSPWPRIHPLSPAEVDMAPANEDSGVYKIVEIIGTSETSWEDATKRAIETASSSLRDLRVAEIVKLDVKLDEGKVVAYRARIMLSFKYES
jgi:dodecin